MIEIPKVTEKRRAVESCIKLLQPNIESYSIDAEEKSKLSIIGKANSFCHTRRKKKLTSFRT